MKGRHLVTAGPVGVLDPAVGVKGVVWPRLLPSRMAIQNLTRVTVREGASGARRER